MKALDFNISLPFETHAAAVQWVKDPFPYVKPLMANMSTEQNAKATALMLDFVKSRHPIEPIHLQGKAVIGWGEEE